MFEMDLAGVFFKKRLLNAPLDFNISTPLLDIFWRKRFPNTRIFGDHRPSRRRYFGFAAQVPIVGT
jgi:hypothetical protein